MEAVRLKEEIEREFNSPVKVRMGGPGALDVYCDGKKIYSKTVTGRMPRAAELVSLIRANLSGGAPESS